MYLANGVETGHNSQCSAKTIPLLKNKCKLFCGLPKMFMPYFMGYDENESNPTIGEILII